MRRSSTPDFAAIVSQLALLGSAAFLWTSAGAFTSSSELTDLSHISHILWITVCEDDYGGSLDRLRVAHCSGGTYCDIGAYNATDETQDISHITLVPGVNGSAILSQSLIGNEEGFEVALIGPDASYGFGYSLDVDPTALMILKEPGYDALCVANVGWQRRSSSPQEYWGHWLGAAEESNLLGNSTTIYFNEPEYAEDLWADKDEETCFGYDSVPYACDPQQRTTCSVGLYAHSTTQTESPCLRGWRFFNLQKDADYEYELKMEGCSGSGSSIGVSASFCPDPYCNTSDVVEETLGDFDSSGATIFPVKLDFNPVAIRLSASAEDGWCANAMSFNGFALAGSYPYEMTANESRIIENVQYFDGEESATPTSDGEESAAPTSDGTPFATAAWPTAMMIFGALAMFQYFAL